ncbi:MAG: ABC transporter substrate-binding protein [Gammaproteobacteria bacterium]
MMRTLLCFMAALLCLLMLAGCEKPLSPPLKLGTNQWIGYQTLFLAQNLHFFDDHQVKLIEMPSATDVARSLRNGSLDIAALTLDEALALMQTLSDLRIFLVMDISMGADALLAKPGIHALADLKHKKIGVENTAVGAMLLSAALHEGGFKVADVELVTIPACDHEKYYLEQKVEALVTFEPHKTRLMAQGATALFDSSQIPGLITDVLVTRASVIQRQEAALKAVIAAHFRALSYFHRHHTQATDIMAQYLGAEPAEVMAQFKGVDIPDLQENRKLLSGDLPALKPKAAELLALMRERQLIFKPVNIDNLTDGRLLRLN